MGDNMNVLKTSAKEINETWICSDRRTGNF